MYILKYVANIVLISLFISLISYSPVQSQRGVTYERLAERENQQNITLDLFTLPHPQANTVRFVVTFRITYDFLPFKKISQPQTDNKFFSYAGLNIEIFKADKDRKKGKELSVSGLESVTRSFWNDTVYAKTYEETRSNNTFASGFVTADLKPGVYNYQLQLSKGEESLQEASRVRQVEIAPYSRKKNGTAIFAKKTDERDNSPILELQNFGQNVLYGEDFYVFIQLPEYSSRATYSISYNRIEGGDDDKTRVSETFQKTLTKDEIVTGVMPDIIKRDNSILLTLQKQDSGHNYALVKIPNSRFPNARYQLKVEQEDQEQPVAQSVIRSLWLDMPRSLLNLDVAIEMISYITGEETIEYLKNGSKSEREKKFRKFWEEKDPTPNTEFNELMAEYYKRVDYTYDNFSTINQIGYKSDRGRIYIKYGPPDKTERKFPAGEAAIEIWTYSNRRLIFQATTGFGDFKLVSK